jgi:SAM-dependent methyltransferase
MNRYFGTHILGGEWHALLPRYLLLAERIRGGRVLDIGCGTGIGSSLLLEMGAESVHGVDHRPEVVDLARVKHDKQGLDFHVMLWETLEFSDDSFDVVLCLDPASPVTDRNLLVEVRRVLRAGGEYICAVERSKDAGLEALLPRYGYESPSDQVSINQPQDRVPQIGELSSYFDTIVNVVQRPHLSYVFEPETADAPQASEPGTPVDPRPEPRQIRHVPDELSGGLWRSDADEPMTPPFDEPGQWIAVDRRLNVDDAETGGVEIFFCGDAHLPPPPLREIRLPYYNLVERLALLITELQTRQSLGGEASSFEEVLDAPNDSNDSSYSTRSFEDDARATRESSGQRQWDETPTQVHRRPARQGEPFDARLDAPELEPRRGALDAHYRRIRRQIDALQHHTREAIAERDGYIDHLVQTIHARETPPQTQQIQKAQQTQPAEDRHTGSSAWEQETTRVFKIATLGAPTEEPVLDDLAGLDPPGDPGSGHDPKELERQIASLYDERLRIDELLAAREARLVELASTSRPSRPADDGHEVADASNSTHTSADDAFDPEQPGESNQSDAEGNQVAENESDDIAHQ